MGASRKPDWHNVMVKLGTVDYEDLDARAHTEDRRLGPMARILIHEALAARKVKP